MPCVWLVRNSCTYVAENFTQISPTRTPKWGLKNPSFLSRGSVVDVFACGIDVNPSFEIAALLLTW